ncbi:MAG: peptidoglycan DD-metalloendopeptidase family protein [Acidimicrobiia bacterium]
MAVRRTPVHARERGALHGSARPEPAAAPCRGTGPTSDRRRAWRRPRSAAAAIVVVLLLTGSVAAVDAAADPPAPHLPPVDAPVLDPFRPPASPWQPGNRGLEYALAEVTPIRATADGTVVFAGAVAGHRHVTVSHPDGVRTSYSFLAEISVVVGQRVEQGQVVGQAGPGFHLGARRGDAYFDPATLFERGPVPVHLVAFELPPGLGPGGERSALAQLVGGVGDLVGGAAAWGFDRAADGVGLAGGWLRRNGSEVLRTLAHYAVPYPIRMATGVVDAALDAHRVASRPCTPSGTAPGPPAGRRLAVRVGGLGSTSDDAAIDDLDLGALGYHTDDTARFSYAGGTTPQRGRAFARLPANPYGKVDSQEDLWVSGAALADVVEQAVEEAPGLPVDLLAHSQGGLVVRAAIIELVDRHGPGWVREHLGEVVTLASPHTGADLATAIAAQQTTVAGDRALEVGEWLTGLDADAASPAQLSEASDFQAELRDRWEEVAHLVEVTSIAARGDLVVPVPRTEVAGAQHVVVSVGGLRAHDDLPGSEEALREVGLALVDRPPSCRSFDTALRDHLQGNAISLVEDAVGSGLWGWSATRGIFRG